MYIDPPVRPGFRAGPSNRATLASAAIGLAALLAAGPARGQQQDTLRQDTVYEIEPIAVRAVRPSATPGGVSALEVRLDSVRFQPAPLLEHVLRELPLVQVRANSRGEAQLALRGAEERQIAILLDGIPLTLGWDHRTDLSVIPLTAAQNIQVVRGLSSMLYGPNVLGGVVNIGMGAVDAPRVDPLRVAVGVDDAGGYAIGVTSGTRIDLDGDRLVVRGGLGRRDREGFAAPADAGTFYPALRGSDLRVNSDLSHTDGFASLRFTGRDGWASVSTTAFRAERGVPPELHVDDPRLWRYPEIWRAVTVLAGGLQRMENGLGWVDLQANLGIDVGGTSIHDFAMPVIDPLTTTDAFYSTLDETETSDDRTLTLRLRSDQHLDSGATIRGAATLADVRHDEVITVDIATGSPQSFPARFRQRLWSLGTEADVPFSLSGLGPFTGGRVSGGVALDGADTPETGGAVPGGGPSTTEWGGRLGISASTSGGGLLVHAAVSRKGRFPALREMYSAALGRFEPNPDLRPEILTVIEAGFTSRFGPYDLQMVGFHQRLGNAIVRGAPPAGSTARFQRVNRDLIRSTGVEVVAGYNLGRAAIETEFTIQDVEVVDPDGAAVRAEYEPAFAGGIGGSLPLPAGVEAGAEIEYWGRQFCSSPEPGQEDYETLDSSTRTDVQLARTFRLPRAAATFRRVGVELAVENLTDTTVYDQCGLPQPGRTLRLQVRIN